MADQNVQEIKKYIEDVSSAKIWECIIIEILVVILVGVICFCVCKKIIDTNNGYLLLLFFLALLCVAGGLTVICVLRCSAVKKQALLTYAYDKALDKIKDLTPSASDASQTDCNKALTKIFQAYCQNITAK